MAQPNWTPLSAACLSLGSATERSASQGGWPAFPAPRVLHPLFPWNAGAENQRMELAAAALLKIESLFILCVREALSCCCCCYHCHSQAGRGGTPCWSPGTGECLPKLRAPTSPEGPRRLSGSTFSYCICLSSDSCCLPPELGVRVSWFS